MVDSVHGASGAHARKAVVKVALKRVIANVTNPYPNMVEDIVRVLS